MAILPSRPGHVLRNRASLFRLLLDLVVVSSFSCIMPPRPYALVRPARRWLTTSPRILRQVANSADKRRRAVLEYAVPVKAFSQETQAFLRGEEGLGGLAEVVGEEGRGEGVVGRGAIVEMRR